MTQEQILYGVLAAALAQLVGFLTIVYNGRQARLRDERNRKWEIEDRVALAKHVLDTSATLALKVADTSATLSKHVIETSAALAQTVTETSAVLAVKVEEATSAIKENILKTDEAKAAAKEAYTEANHANLKIAALMK